MGVVMSSIIELHTHDIPADTLEWQDETPDLKNEPSFAGILLSVEKLAILHPHNHLSKRNLSTGRKEKPVAPVRAKKLREARNSVKPSNLGDPQPITAERIAELIYAPMKTAQLKLVDSVASSMLTMESRLERSLKDKMSAMLTAAGQGTVADQVIRDIDTETETDRMNDELSGRNPQTYDQKGSDEPKTQDIGDGDLITEPVTEQPDDPALCAEKIPGPRYRRRITISETLLGRREPKIRCTIQQLIARQGSKRGWRIAHQGARCNRFTAVDTTVPSKGRN
ncbi:unnamed protein product [Thlaspi arvense]|uniref:Uncharacterized protein n=1 Tax=Thlaspi arvense TaxID=13288 RepID=A0AAU9R4R9_THLAR|nr:unnamed protein product [Thlaspi arvense]